MDEGSEAEEDDSDTEERIKDIILNKKVLGVEGSQSSGGSSNVPQQEALPSKDSDIYEFLERHGLSQLNGFVQKSGLQTVSHLKAIPPAEIQKFLGPGNEPLC